MTSSPTNNPTKAGQIATRKRVRFGDHKRYEVAAVHTRFEKVQWFVFDWFSVDPEGNAKIIRQEATRAEAVNGLDD